jgi:hypothetical protein
MLEKITELTKFLKLNNFYIVPCLEEEVKTKDLLGNIVYVFKRYTPVTSEKPHNDIENGQNYLHYHVDYRFKFKKNSELLLNSESLPRINNNLDKYKIVWNIMECIKLENDAITPKTNIYKSKLKHKCIYKGKCPHRGQSLIGIPGVNGIITCPNHGLQFNEITKELIK